MIKKVDEFVLHLKNRISEFIFNNFDEYIQSNKYEFCAHYKKFVNKKCPLSKREVRALFQDIYMFYDMYMKKQFKNFKFQVQKEIKYTYYKTDTNDHKKGNLRAKKIIFRSPEGNIAKIVKYLIFLKDFENIPEKIQIELNKYNSSRQLRILHLAKAIRSRILKSLHMMQFKTGSYKKFKRVNSSAQKRSQGFKTDTDTIININMKLESNIINSICKLIKSTITKVKSVIK